MRATLENPKVLRSSVEAICYLVDEAGIDVSPEGLRLRALDPAHVAIADLQMASYAFSEFEAEETTLGVDLDRLNTILKRAGNGSTLLLASDGNSLEITIQQAESKRTFQLPLVEVAGEEVREPSLEFSAEIELDPKIFSEALKDVGIISENIVIRADDEGLKFTGQNWDNKAERVEISVPEERLFSFSLSEACQSMFSLEYLGYMTKAEDFADSLKIQLGQDIPGRFEYISEGVSLVFFVAPRVEE